MIGEISSALGDKAFSFAGKILKSKLFWFAVILIILIIVTKRNWYKIKGWFRAPDINTDLGVDNVTAERKTYLRSLARYIYNDLKTDIWLTTPLENINKAAELDDLELKFLSQYYNSSLSPDKTLYDDVDEEFWTFLDKTSGRDNLLSKLKKINEI